MPTPAGRTAPARAARETARPARSPGTRRRRSVVVRPRWWRGLRDVVVRQPVGRDDDHVASPARDIALRRALASRPPRPGLRTARSPPRPCARAARSATSSSAVARHEVVQVAVEEAVRATSPRTAGAGKATGPRRSAPRPLGAASTRLDLALERRVQLADDLVLVAEVVVEVARADVHLVGDHRVVTFGSPKAVEQPQARLQDALARAALAACAPCGSLERSSAGREG